jgi:hypothetical protein
VKKERTEVVNNRWRWSGTACYCRSGVIAWKRISLAELCELVIAYLSGNCDPATADHMRERLKDPHSLESTILTTLNATWEGDKSNKVDEAWRALSEEELKRADELVPNLTIDDLVKLVTSNTGNDRRLWEMVAKDAGPHTHVVRPIHASIS